MGTPSATMLVSIIDKLVLVKISGRANFAASVDFKSLVSELRARGDHAFALELSECVIMDSTFLGVLSGLGLKIAETEGPARLIQLVNAPPRIVDLLENLGVAHLFKMCQQSVPSLTQFEAVPASGVAPTREEISRTCLEAHQLLMAINPDNVPKFKDVARFLAEDLKKITGGAAEKTGS